MKLTRRHLFRTGAVAVGGATAAGSLGAARASAADAAAAEAARPVTTARTLVRGATPGPGGYRPVVPGPAESHLVRTDLGALAAPGRAGVRVPVIAFAQLSDVHVVDAQSPLRLEFSDRIDDPSP
ncbi:MAG TPA: hypothetical protein VNQ53_18505, partial [Nocardioides sp.]|nr:hypothetical protein [Nocardioides sp.]